MTSTAPDWRLETRYRLADDVSEERLDTLMDMAEESGLALSRDPIGLSLIGYVPSGDGVPEVALSTHTRSATAWLGEHGVPAVLVSTRALREDLHEHEAQQPDTPDLLAATDVAELLRISRQRVHQLLSDHRAFPAPYARLGSGPIWTRPAVEAFARGWTRRPGRRRRDAPARRAG